VGDQSSFSHRRSASVANMSALNLFAAAAIAFGKKKPPPPEPEPDTTFATLVSIVVFWILPLAAMYVKDMMARKKPTINYFSIAGRGELARLICAAGGVEFEDKAWAPAFDASGGWRQGYQAIGNALGFPGTMPVLEAGDFKLFQSQAIESYLASIAPKFEDLTPEERATDLMFALTKADINASTEALLFKKIKPEDLKPIIEKWYPIVESMLPASGFVLGKAYPTVADLSVLVIAKACMPFQAAPQLAGCAFDGKKFPKMERVAAAAAAYGPVAAYLKKSEHQTLKADPFGIMPASYKA